MSTVKVNNKESIEDFNEDNNTSDSEQTEELIEIPAKIKSSKNSLKSIKHLQVAKRIKKKLSTKSIESTSSNIKQCMDCNTKVKYNNNRCMKCANKNRFLNTKSKRPPYGQLKKDLSSMTYVGIGKKYGVSDNSVRKWKKIYEKYGYSF